MFWGRSSTSSRRGGGGGGGSCDLGELVARFEAFAARRREAIADVLWWGCTSCIQLNHSLQAPGLHPCSYEVKN
jgi:hypothetical protein